ncbi:hypothetical protein [Anabaena sp. CCY 9402-a]|uniref:hypothetical protein n=1 Tax=Anabaena sp. CCY 9402-a TaxID=3103867 RepID=UPI0039C644FD
MGEVKKVKGLLDDFISLVEEHDSGETPGFIDVRKMPPEVQETIHQNFRNAMDAIHDMVQGKQQ